MFKNQKHTGDHCKITQTKVLTNYLFEKLIKNTERV